MSETPARHTNRLAGETSPYLLQHAHNPVDWYPWGEEALERARREQRPIFLSIGYAACHWCHVMERESFEDEATAAYLAENFIAVKVDREERPDLDAIYMDAVQQMTGQGGWPMSVFLTPDGKPFYGGTYFPNERRYGMPSFRDVLEGVAAAWRERRADVEAAGDRLTEAIDAGMRHAHDARRATGDPSQPALAAWMLDAAMVGFERSFDARTGGWGGAPKFPQPMAVEALLREHVRTGDDRPLAMARRTLDAMAAGGIYDHIGGGFARYATDAAWLVPHFEKMLYDNAQLARVYVHAHRLTGDPRYAEVARETLDFVARELRVPPDGGFASSLDADTDGEEGRTYVWTAEELEKVLSDDAPLFAAAYGVTPGGNWEGKTILSRVRTDAELADDLGMGPDEVARRLAAAREHVHERRRSRPQPGRDDKVLAAWNGLMLGAYADAARALGDERYAAIASEAAAFLLRELLDADGRLRRSWKDGRATQRGVLEDHAHLADGLLSLYEATFDERWFHAARDLMDTVLDRFTDPVGGFFDTADDHERLITRPKGLQDNALPSGNAMATVVLLRLAAWTGEDRYRAAAERALGTVTDLVHRHPTAFAQWLVALQLALVPIDEVAVIGRPSADDTRALLDVAARPFRPFQVLACGSGPDGSAIPLLEGRTAVDGRATAYVCRGFTCERPVTDPEALSARLDSR